MTPEIGSPKLWTRVLFKEESEKSEKSWKRNFVIVPTKMSTTGDWGHPRGKFCYSANKNAHNWRLEVTPEGT
jgi:hypothetical protein